MKPMEYWYRATVISNHDGDTVTLDIDMGRRIRITDSIRLLGINAPELSQPGGKEARDYLTLLIPPGTKVRVQTFKNKNDKYGRWLGDIFVEACDGTMSINEIMVTNGHAVLAGY